MLPSASCSTQVRVPCSTPAAPPAKRAACRPGLMPSPPASTPISRTPASSMNASKMPMALLPPPTQATTASGSRPTARDTAARLAADHGLELADHQRDRDAGRAPSPAGSGCRRGRATQSRIASLMASFSVRLPASTPRHVGAEQPHAEDVERLARACPRCPCRPRTRGRAGRRPWRWRRRAGRRRSRR